MHVSGINTIIDYAPAIFQSAGWKIDAALASTFLVGITELLFTVASLWMIDRFGRKPLYIGGSFGMAVALVLLVIAVLTGHFHGGLVLALILAYLAFFCACIGPVFWTLVPEIFPNDVRGMAMTLPGAAPVGCQCLRGPAVPLRLSRHRQVRSRLDSLRRCASARACSRGCTFPKPRTSAWKKSNPTGYEKTGRHEVARSIAGLSTC